MSGSGTKKRCTSRRLMKIFSPRNSFWRLQRPIVPCLPASLLEQLTPANLLRIIPIQYLPPPRSRAVGVRKPLGDNPLQVKAADRLERCLAVAQHRLGFLQPVSPHNLL